MMHFVMSIQSVWNSEPSGAATLEGLIDPAEFGYSRQAIYREVFNRTKAHWYKLNAQISMGTPVVMVFSLEPDSIERRGPMAI